MTKTRLSKRILSVVCAFSLIASLFSATSILGAWASGETTDSWTQPPAAPENRVDWIGYAKKDVIGGGYGWVADRVFQEQFTAVDLTKGQFIEFDFYISNYQLAKENGMGDIWFAVSSGGNRFAGRSRYNISSQVTKSGWNHIKLTIDDPRYNDGETDYTAVKNYMLHLDGGETGAAGDVQVGVQNLCTTKWVPEQAELLHRPGVVNDTLKDLYYSGSFAAKDLSALSYFEFDVYVTNYAAIVENGGNPLFWVSSDGLWGARKAYNFKKYISHEGWNHVKIPVNIGFNPGGADCNLAAVTDFGFFFESGSAPAGAAFNIKNFYATGETEPTKPTTAVVTLDEEGVTHWIGGGFNWVADRVFKQDGLTATNFKQADFIEFDLYFSDLTIAQRENMPALMMAFGSANGNRFADRVKYNITSQVTRSGWNHIRLPIEPKEADGSPNLEAICTYMLYFDTPNQASGDAEKVQLTIKNVVGTQDTVPTLPENATAVLDANGVSDWVGQIGWVGDRITKSDLPATDMSVGAYLEMDVFVGNIAALRQAGMGTMDFSIASGDNRYSQRTHYNITDQVTKNGWNHVKVPLSASTHDDGGHVDFTQVKHYILYLEGSHQGANLDVPIRIRNICATPSQSSVNAPAMDKTPVSVLDEAGKATMLEQFAGVGDRMYKENVAHANMSNAKYIEFDLFVGDWDAARRGGVNEVYFSLNSGDQGRFQNRAHYDITRYITKSGWNHVKMPVSEVKRYENGETNFQDITTYMVYVVGEQIGSTLNLVELEIRNICATTPKVPTDAIDLFDETGVTSEIGGGFHWVRDRLTKTGLTAIDRSKFETIELDLYVGNLAAVKAAGLTKIRFAISSNQNPYSDRRIYDITDQVTMSGWNHVSIPVDAVERSDGTPDDAKLISYMVDFEGPENSGEAGNVTIAIRNICTAGTVTPVDPMDTKPTMPNDPVYVMDEAGKADTIGGEFGHVNDKLFKEGFAAVNFDLARYIEFDLYVGKLDVLRAQGLSSIRFGISSAVMSDTVDKPRFINRAHYDILNQVTTNGWNHIRIEVDSSIGRELDNGTIDWTKVVNYMVIMDGAATNGAFANVPVAIANVCATDKIDDPSYPRPSMPQNPALVITEDGFSNSTLKDLIFEMNLTGKPLDLTGIDNLEFDVFVSDYDGLLASNAMQGFSLSSGDNKWDFRAHYNYTPYLAKTGWNHVRIPITEIMRYETGNQTDMAAVTFLMFYSQGKAPGKLIVKNLCGTKNVAVDDKEAPSFTGPFSLVRRSGRSLTIGWKSAVDNYTMKPKMRYQAYYSKNAITADNLAEATKFADSQNILSATINGLSEETDYYFAVVAIDEAGNKTVVYGSEPFATTAKAEFMTLFELNGRDVMRADQVGMDGDVPMVSKTFIRNTEATSGWYNNLLLRQPETAEYRDITGYNAIVFDLYISDIAKYNAIWKQNMYVLVQSGTEGEKDFKTETFLLRDVEMKEGWNQVVLDIANPVFDLGKVSNLWLATFPANDSNLGYYPDPALGDCDVTFKMKNVQVTTKSDFQTITNAMENPQFLLPGDSWIFMNGYGADHPKMHSMRRVSAPIDISNATHLEFDFYISDLDALKEYKDFQNFRVRLLTSDDEWTNCLFVDFTEYVKTSGWNHIKVPIKNGWGEGEVNLETFKGAMFYLESQALKPTEDFKIAYRNLYATTKQAAVVTPDPDAPSRPDKDATYISDCEGLAIDGTWNPATVLLDLNNKTEGKASVSNIFTAQTIRANSMRFVRTDPLNLTGAKKLKFDLWVSDAELLRQRTKLSVRLCSDNRGYADYFNWQLDTTNLQNGWNSIEIDLSGATIDGDADWSSISVFNLLCDEANFDEENEEEVLVKLDNIRVTGASSDSGNVNTGAATAVLPLATAALALAGLGVTRAWKGKKED